MHDNPAERLHDLLSAFKGVANQPMLSAWAAVLGAERDNLPELLHAVAAFTALPAQLEADLRAALPDNDPPVSSNAVRWWLGAWRTQMGARQ